MLNKFFELDNGKLSKNPFRIAIQSMRKIKGLVFVSLFLLLLKYVSFNLIPLFNKYLFDAVEVLQFSEIYKYLGFYIVALVGFQVFDFVYWIISIKMFAKMQTQIRHDILSYLNLHSLNYYASRSSGSVVNAYHSLKDACDLFFVFIESVLLTFVSLLVAAGLCFAVNVYLGIGLLIWNILLILFSWKFIQKLGVRTVDLETKAHIYQGFLGDFLSNIKVLKIFNVFQETVVRMHNFVDVFGRSALRKWRFKSLFSSYLDFSDVVLMLALSVVLGHLYFAGLITLGDVTMVFVLGQRIDIAMKDFATELEYFMDRYQAISVSVRNLFVEHDNLDKDDVDDLVLDAEVGIELRNLSFRYPESKSKSSDLIGVNLSIKPGEKIGIVGRSGAGKSTLFKLLQRQFEIADGQVFFNGCDIMDYTKTSILGHMSVVEQDNLMFNRSLKENIVLGRDVSEERLMQVLKDSHCLEFIEQLPDGLGTMIGERGVKLSGGQRQRVAIARAMVDKAPIVLLDEATSALDSESEKVISDAFRNLSEGHTMLCIAHRLSTLYFVDRIVVMDQGRIVNVGTHAWLLENCDIYASLASSELE